MYIYIIKPAMFTYKVGLDSAVVLAESKTEALELLKNEETRIKRCRFSDYRNYFYI